MKLIDKLPFFYRTEIFESIINSHQIEVDRLYEHLEDFKAQLYVETATWGLEYWEKYLFLPTDNTKSYELRRSIILAHLRGANTTTKEVLKAVAKSFYNVENVDVIEKANYLFTILLENVDFTEADFKDLLNVVQIIRPAHLDYELMLQSKSTVNLITQTKECYSKIPLCGITMCGQYPYQNANCTIYSSKMLVNRNTKGYSKVYVCGQAIL